MSCTSQFVLSYQTALFRLAGCFLGGRGRRCVGRSAGIVGVAIDLNLSLLCASLLTDPAMAGSGSSSPWGTHLFKAILMVLVGLVLLHSASSQSQRDFAPPGQQKREASADLLTQIGRSLRGTLDTWLGPETMHLVSEVRSSSCFGKEKKHY